MPYILFTASETSSYDDRIEERYHFPRTYLAQAQQAVGGWVVYYEPRRNAGLSSSGGRQAYFAIARLDRIEADPMRSDHFYARLSQYMEFDQAIPFKENGRYYESSLVKPDGSTNRGQFGRSVRLIQGHEFAAIVRAGFTFSVEPWERESLQDGGFLRVADEVPEYVVRPMVEQVVSRKFRDVAFRRHVRSAYGNRCAMTGLRLINGGGRPEVQAAHIRSVEADGPDTVRNGLALTGTFHWLFDRGLVSISDEYDVMVSPQGVPDDLERLLVPERKLLLPDAPQWRPHQTYLSWHRDHVFKR
ncbi:HNH endonuclease [Lysobacter sp. A378]